MKKINFLFTILLFGLSIGTIESKRTKYNPVIDDITATRFETAAERAERREAARRRREAIRAERQRLQRENAIEQLISDNLIINAPMQNQIALNIYNINKLNISQNAITRIENLMIDFVRKNIATNYANTMDFSRRAGLVITENAQAQIDNIIEEYNVNIENNANNNANEN